MSMSIDWELFFPDVLESESASDIKSILKQWNPTIN